MVSIRRSVAGALIRLAHRIYPPRVTVDHSINFHGPIQVGDLQELLLQGEVIHRDLRSW